MTIVNYSLFVFLSYFFFLSSFTSVLIFPRTLFGEGASSEYTEPQDVATTEGLPSSLVNESVCVITGEYTDSILDLVIPGPEPLTLNRVYTSFSGKSPWSFNNCDRLILENVFYNHSPSHLISFR